MNLKLHDIHEKKRLKYLNRDINGYVRNSVGSMLMLYMHMLYTNYCIANAGEYALAALEA
jgi:hypothetical protein